MLGREEDYTKIAEADDEMNILYLLYKWLNESCSLTGEPPGPNKSQDPIG